MVAAVIIIFVIIIVISHHYSEGGITHSFRTFALTDKFIQNYEENVKEKVT